MIINILILAALGYLVCSMYWRSREYFNPFWLSVDVGVLAAVAVVWTVMLFSIHH